MQMLICKKKMYTTLTFMNLNTELNLDCAEMQFIIILVSCPVYVTMPIIHLVDLMLDPLSMILFLFTFSIYFLSSSSSPSMYIAPWNLFNSSLGWSNSSSSRILSMPRMSYWLSSLMRLSMMLEVRGTACRCLCADSPSSVLVSTNTDPLSSEEYRMIKSAGDHSFSSRYTTIPGCRSFQSTCLQPLGFLISTQFLFV